MPTTTTIPNFTYNSAGNIRASASLTNSGTANYDVDYSAVMQGIVTVKNTPGGSVSSTRGVRVDVYNRYGSSPTTDASPVQSYTLPSATASTAEDLTIWLQPGKYNIKITNLDATNAVTVEITGDTMVLQTQ
jgi:hypothetical protein